VNIAQFRNNFPEFSDLTAYPDAVIGFWGNVAELQVRECIWKRMWCTGVQLYVAHEITLAAQNIKTAGFGGVPGTMGGVPNQKTVGAASVGYDSQSNSEKDGGYWNLTNYGKQFLRLARIFGAGAIQL
jgi:hypothetical protein